MSKHLSTLPPAVLHRRHFLRQAGMGAVGLVSAGALARANTAASASEEAMAVEAATPDGEGLRAFPENKRLARIHADANHIIKETVGLRPFRETGPNMSVEPLARGKTIVHHYGHGGSGWSLSWGSAHEAVGKAAQTGDRHVAVLGCGAIGMTTAILLQRAGKSVRIYTKDRQPHTTSSVATGVWSPDSRICLEAHATPAFEKWWTQTAARSFRSFQDRLGLTNRPVEWVDAFSVSNRSEAARQAEREGRPGPKFGHFDRLPEVPESWDVDPASSPFSEKYVRQGTRMIYNIPAYCEMMMNEFFQSGGRLDYREFHSVDEIAALPENTIVNCTGFGAKKLFKDEQMVPVRGQLTFLVPQPEVGYNLSTDGAYTIARRDGIVVGSMDNGRYGSTDLAPDRQQSLDAVAAIAQTMAGLRSPSS